MRFFQIVCFNMADEFEMTDFAKWSCLQGKQTEFSNTGCL